MSPLQYGCQQSAHSEKVLSIEVCKCGVKVAFTWNFIMRVVNKLHSEALSGKSIKTDF